MLGNVKIAIEKINRYIENLDFEGFKENSRIKMGQRNTGLDWFKLKKIF